jgi:inner membrane protein
MTDAAPPPPMPAPAPAGRDFFRPVFDYLSSNSLVGRAVMLAVLTLLLKIPLSMVGGVISDRQSYESEAINNVRESWGRAQTFIGPMVSLPYKPANSSWIRALTLLPERLVINGKVVPEQRRRGLFVVTVYTADLDIVAEFKTKEVRDVLAEGDWVDWGSARLTLGLSDTKSITPSTVDLDGQPVDWFPDKPTPLSLLQAPLALAALANRDTVTVRFRATFAGSGNLSMVPLGRRTDVNLASSWPSPSFMGRYLPASQKIDKDGFTAKWSISALGRGYGQLWDGVNSTEPAPRTVLESSFGLTLLNTVDAYRETDRAIKYGIMFIGLTFAACLMFEFVGGTRPSVAQYGLIGLSLCVFYLLLLSLSEQIGFGLAYLVSSAAVVGQAAIYNWALQRRRGPALAFGVLLAGLYGGLYGLLQLEDVALLAGSLLLFAVLSLAMWFTRNLHRGLPTRAAGPA